MRHPKLIFKLSLLFNIKKIFWIFIGLCFASTVQSATYLNKTRLIIQEKDPDVTFSLTNQGQFPALMQLWIDQNNLFDRPELIKSPFLITPSLFRLDASKKYAVRIQLVDQDEAMAKDRESLFWLNVLEVPPKPLSSVDSNSLQLAFRTRIKLFYRPSILATTNLTNEIKKLQSDKVNCLSGRCLSLKNHSPLHISLLNITLNDNQIVSDLPNDGMIAPFSTIEIPLDNPENQLKKFIWIDEDGVLNDVNQQ